MGGANAVERPEAADEPTGYWMSDLPVTTPVADLVHWAKMRRRIEYQELIHGVDHFEGRTWRIWHGWHHHVTLVTAARGFLTLRRYDSTAHASA
jgi:SRSO17 transposase